ncbi:HGGxSTG domain-containing protein [Bradyrhizobium elkanii]|uniref:HGGxSTG domain-containing protein n=1 Tax=Bradyrhizobium elkanii TaxID=29448 RepID=UPI001BA46DB5|nr:HGGxSTG domain-containing protein [Bradyrhizobium elkanii]MBR1160272.1 hypothetical protein [Bradyrhizobium elkanii]
MSDHIGNTGPMLASPRCGAKTRSGNSCRAPAVHGKTRCRVQEQRDPTRQGRTNRKAH